MRLGYAMGNENLIIALNKIKNSVNSYTVDSLSIKAGIEAIKDKEWFQLTTQKVITTRNRVVEDLKAIGFYVIDSKANFIFITHPICNAEKLFKSLKEMGVLVRYFEKPGIENYIRVSIGTDAEMDTFLETISTIIS